MPTIEDISLIKGINVGIEYVPYETLAGDFEEDDDLPQYGMVVIDLFFIRFLVGIN